MTRLPGVVASSSDGASFVPFVVAALALTALASMAFVRRRRA
jgi:MYXO-CTERM domain-containing protein